jgi:hypothetical protein
LSWLPPGALHALDWAEADIQVVDAYRKKLGKGAT